MTDQDHGHHHHDGQDGHSHGHHNDQGLKGALRYLRWAPQMWRSELNVAVVDALAPQRGERVLDIGAGMGPASVRAARLGATVVAVEPTPFLRTVLRVRRLGQRARGRLAVVAASAEALGVPDSSIDALWAVNTMHHWVDVEAGVNEIVRVLKPDGRFFLVDEDFNDPSHPEFGKWGDDHEHGEGHNHHGFTLVHAEEMGLRFAAAGLAGVVADKREVAGRPSVAVSYGLG